MRRNILAKVQELGISQSTKHTIVEDLFGKQAGSHYIEGLVDARNNAQYNKGLAQLFEKWKSLDVFNEPVQEFVQWYSRYKSATIQATMLQSTRRDAGLGDPPEPFTTNASESMNALLKNKVEYKRSELPEFLEKLKEAINEQDREVERAVINRGKYKLLPEFQSFEKTEEEWFLKMSVVQRQRHLDRLAKVQVSKADISRVAKRKRVENQPTPSTKRPCTPSDLPCCSRQLLAKNVENAKVILPVKVEEFSGQVLTPAPVLNAIWKKAVDLLSEKNALCAAPGSTDKSCIVKSYTGSHPHLVLAKKGGQYACDSACGNWKSLGICSHSVAAAQYNGELPKFVEWFRKAKKHPNLTKLVTSQMPAGRGRKGGKSARRRTKKKCDPTPRVLFSDRFSVSSAELAEVSSEFQTSTSPPGTVYNTSLPPPLVPIVSTVPIRSPICTSLPPVPTHAVTYSSAVPTLSYAVSTTPSAQSRLQSCTSRSVGTTPTHVPSLPPALVSCSPATNDSPFTLTFIVGNIRVCRGCRQRYAKPAIAPMDLCVRHKEWQEFTPSGSAVSQMRFGNVYYHCNIPCILARCPYYKPEMLIIPAETALQLLPVHSEYLARHMGRK